jgi:GNAT superfamily N-acetyltransferase
MLRGLQTVPVASLPDAFDLTDRAPVADVATVQSEAFGDPYDVTYAFVEPKLGPRAAPPQLTLTAYAGSEPVACATVVWMDGVAGVYGVAVREAWRRQGLGAGLTAACLQQAARAGCDLAYLNPSDIGYGVYASLGFVDALPLRVWVPD